MLNRNLVVGPDYRALEETPNVLDGVGMNLASDILPDAVIDSLMAGIVISDATIRPPVVGVDRLGIGGGGLVNELVECLVIFPPEFSSIDLPLPIEKFLYRTYCRSSCYRE